MSLLKVLPVILIVFISGCAAQVSGPTQEQTTPPVEQPQQETTPIQPPTEGTLQGEVTPQPTPTPSPTPTPVMKEFTMETDDSGYYTNGQKITSISATVGEVVKITFNLRTQGIYPAGAEYRGCGTQSSSAPPGGTTSVQFTASSPCTITAYWPASGVAKASLQVLVS